MVRKIFVILFLGALSGCVKNYYKTNPVTQKSDYPAAIEQAKKDKRYFIFYSGINIYSVTSIETDKTKQHFTVQLDKVDSLHIRSVKKPKAMRDKEIHLYMRDSTSYTLDEPHTILLDKVERIELMK